jgi:hypothetical protein
MCWELLTKQKYYGIGADMGRVVETLKGNVPLPSEGVLTAETMEKLGNSGLRNSILSMLQRDAAMRPSVSHLLQSWTSIFSSTAL